MYNRAFLEKLIVPYLVKKFFLMEPEVLSPLRRSQETTLCFLSIVQFLFVIILACIGPFYVLGDFIVHPCVLLSYFTVVLSVCKVHWQFTWN